MAIPTVLCKKCSESNENFDKKAAFLEEITDRISKRKVDYFCAASLSHTTTVYVPLTAIPSIVSVLQKENSQEFYIKCYRPRLLMRKVHVTPVGCASTFMNCTGLNISFCNERGCSNSINIFYGEMVGPSLKMRYELAPLRIIGIDDLEKKNPTAVNSWVDKVYVTPKNNILVKTEKIENFAAEVDIVYTWVDGADLEWQAEKAKWDENFTGLVSANNAQRFISRDELKYSLRSISMYLSSFRKIYIVTNGQVPKWLNLDHPQIELVTHKDIFKDQSDLPTFNSHSIESQLHHIEGLSEYFLYMNDDVLLGKKTDVSIFFEANGLSKHYISPASFANTFDKTDAIPTDRAAYNMQKLIHDNFDAVPTRKMMHTPHPLRRSVLYEIEKRFAKEHAQTASARFRSETDLAIPSMLYPYYAWCSGKAIFPNLGKGNYIYFDTGKANMRQKINRIKRVRPYFICANSTMHEEIPLEKQVVIMKNFFEKIYNMPSPFEIQETEPD